MLRLQRFLLITAISVAPVACFATSKGPDSGNYTGTNVTVYSFIDVSQTGASVLSGADDGTAPLTIPFLFQFYGTPYTMVCVSSNGALYFITSSTACSGLNDFANVDLSAMSTPSNLPAALPFWSDLTFQVPGAGAVYYQTSGKAGSRKFIVQWNNAYPQGSSNPVTFEAVLSEGSNSILFQYQTASLGAGNPANNGGQATIGISNGSVSSGDQIQWSYDAPVVSSNSSILFSVAQPSMCASDVSSTISVRRGGFAYNSGKQVFVQAVTLTNSGGTAVAAPVYLVLNGLSSNTSLANASGATSCISSGNPYITVLPSGSLAPGQSVSIQLNFGDPTKLGITYTTQVLAGSGLP